ncbi:hypothetical protein L2719_06465 [Shewanella schlegeliana]|uniref:DUF4062 domain-containing protein n=1 Tax=Shewanella schlegeliana TaxID=190308 RepID=A0ABS1T073_9GAMM|nr:hypothetical protein [Shewanella schlegeliana]MBL4913232.1 hypothetical protein [Shewanella schlegeliana]MCL1109187.1 hypothetical protein [Shewanella schlegeliana]GIU24278.1 hypothetical protein TUM4433_07740 [Shewanella schlegeliana]
MARSETVISVFVASPGDVADERSALETIISELNRTWSKTLNLRLELIRWETDIHPSFGAYPQDVINKQVADDYDVFIALFWSKVGTPTAVAESGTIEEFQRAYEKHKASPNSIDIMVYFKDQAIPPSKMDFEQLQKLQSLKKQLGEKGGLYWDFESTEDFENMVRGHLSRVAQAWSQKLISSEKNNEPNLENKLIVVDEAHEDEDEYGLFDYVEIYEDRLSDMNSAFELMSDATVKIGSQFNKRMLDISNLPKLEDGSYAQADTRKIIKLTSDDLTRYSEILEPQVSIATSSRTEAFDALSKGISISIELNHDHEAVEDLKSNLTGLLSSATSAQDGLIGFRESVLNLPKLTLQLNKAKRVAIKSLDRVLAEIRKTIRSTEDVLDTIYKIELAKCNDTLENVS